MKAIYTIHNFAKRLVMIMAVGLMAVNVWGADELYATITFLDNGTGTDGSSAFTTKTDPADYLSPSSSVSGFSAAAYVYQAQDECGWKFGSGSYNGDITLTLASTISNVKKIVVNAKKYSSTKATTINCNSKGAQSLTNSFADYEFTYASATSVSSIQLVSTRPTSSDDRRCYVKYIKIYVEPSGYAVTYNNGEHGTAPSNTTATSVTLAAITGVTGWTCTGWKANVAVTNTSTSASIAAGTSIANGTNVTLSQATTFTAQWSANQYTVTLNDNTGSGGSGSKTVTYNANTNLTTSVAVPTKAHHDFAGYWTSTDNGATFGTKLVNADGSWVASVTNYTDASKNWIKADNVTLYAKWTEHSLTNYRTSCCTELGTIDGEATLTQGGNSVTISGWSDVSNVGTYTVKLYKKNGASWDLVSGSAANGDAGTAGTRTGISSSSKSVTYTGLEVESEYKFTVQAIAGSAAYCDGAETAVTEINDVDVSSTPFMFRYSIYIDNGSNRGWAHHYITPTGNTDEGSVDITLAGPVDYYQFKIGGGFSGWWGQTGESKYTTGGTQWTLDGSQNVKMQTWIGGIYTFTVDYSGTTNPKVTITYPSANQDAGNIVYWDASVVANWDHLHFRVGTDGNANAGSDCKTDLQKVPGTDNFYKVTTASFTGMRVWAIANNTGWMGSNTNGVYKTNTGDGYAVTLSSDYQDYVVEEDGVTLVPYGSGAMGSYSHDNNCRFYTVTKTDGMLTHNVSLNSPAHGTLLVTYTNTSGTTGQTVTEGNNADLAHRCILTITATPATGYTCTSLTVNSSNFTSGNTHILSADAVVEATFTAKSCTANFDKNSGTGGDASTTATYGSAMTTVTAPTRTGYTFDGYWDGETNNNGSGTQYYLANGTSARNWDKDVTATQTLYAKWNAKQYTITLDREGAASGAESVTATYDAGTLAGWSAPTKTGYTFGGYWSGDNGTGTLVISTTGVLQNSVTISAVNWTDASGHWIKDGGVTLYAKWTADEYTISYKDEGNVAYSGSNSALLPTTHTYGAATDLVDGVKSGYRFDGWFDNSTCTGSAITSIGATAITANTTYYAKWTQVYTVTWSVNGDTWESGVVEGNTLVPGGSKVSALPTAPTKSDCDDSKVFVGWKAAEIDGTSAGAPGGIFTTQAGSPTISANTNFYAVFADVTGGNVIELTFPDDNSENNGLTSNQYTSTWTAMSGTTSFSISNFNNNNWAGSWTNIRCGRDKTASTATITTDDEIGFRVDSVYLTMDAITASGVDTMKLYIDDNSSFSSPEVIGVKKQATTQGFEIASQAKDQYYKFEFTCNNSVSSNGYVRISKVVFKQKKDTANYVTSCSSCDADATFTNETPAVSEIGCTGATLTATGGLGTLGADGCHVSDYGFVIGTADNPAIGGSGVTKLQVGTSDPTIGEDFSYDATGLTKGTHYYIRAYAINRHGTAYSSSQNFWTNNVSSIAITTAPTKTNYLVGETFDATGMVVTATLASSATEDVTSDVTYSDAALTAGTSQNFAINYTLCETAKSVNQVINVYTLTVTEGTNPSYGTAAGSVNVVSITGLGDHKTYTVTVTSDNADVVDNGDNTWSVINPTGNVTVRVDYADAVQVKVYYKVDGVTVTGLTQDVYQSETTTLPTASELATAMTAQSMDLPDDDYPNFVGWSETEFSSQTSEPTIVSGTPAINAEKTYYAVYTNLNKITIIPSDFSTSYPSSGSADGTKTFGGKRFGWNYLLNGNVSKTNLPLQFKKNSTEYGRLYNTDPLNYILRIEIGYYNADSYVPVYVASGAGTISGGALTPASRESTDPYVYTMPANTSYFYIKGDNSTVYKIRSVDIYYSPATIYYMTQFCTNRVTLTQNNPEHGTVEFGRSSLVTCGSDKEVSLTIIPDVGYQLTGWTVNTATGYADAKTTSPAVVTNSNNSAAQNITLTFAEDANKDYDVTATFGLMTVSSWAWTLNSAAIPDPLNLYVGQSARLDVAYTPAGVDNSKKTYERTKVDAYINWVGGLQATYSTISGKASTGENTTAVTFTHADGPTTTVNVKVLPLPLVHFGDIVHNVEFADVVATLSDNTLSPTKTTPTHADFDGSTANTCEEQHLHLVGWIREDWPSLVTYLNGGAQPGTDDITGAGNDASGNAYFFAPGASINTQTFNGVTFYAVWAKVE